MSSGSFKYKISIEMFFSCGDIYYYEKDKTRKLIPSLEAYIWGTEPWKQDSFELFLELDVRWYFCAESHYDPPEAGEEVDLVAVYVENVKLPNECVDKFYDFFEDLINNYEIPKEAYY